MDYQEMYQQQAQQQNNPPAPAKKPSPKELFEKYKKQIIAGGVVVLALIVVLIIWLCSAFGSTHGEVPELDTRKAKNALNDAGYSVTIKYETSYEGLDIVSIEEYLFACDDSYENYIYIVTFKDDTSAKQAYTFFKDTLESSKKASESMLPFINHTLDTYSYKMTSSQIDEYKEMLNEIEESTKTYNNISIGVSGNVFWFGTNDAAKDSKGK